MAEPTTDLRYARPDHKDDSMTTGPISFGDVLAEIVQKLDEENRYRTPVIRTSATGAPHSTTPRVTPEGFISAYICRRCLTAAEHSARQQIRRTRHRAVCPQPPAGMGCGRPMTTLDDFIPVRTKL